MNTKNLSVKFAVLAVIVAFCLGTLKFSGLKQGIDLRGGHSLVFEIYSNQDRIAALEKQEKVLQTRIETDKTPSLTEELEGVRRELEQVRQEGSEDLTPQMIENLKKRIDPLGLNSLEWRPVGRNRFEVRMPAGKEENVKAKASYRQAMDELENMNVRRSQLRRLEMSSASARQQMLARLAGNDEKLASLLNAMVRAYDLQAKSGKQSDISDWEETKQAVLKYNINVPNLEMILKSYVSKAELEALKGKQKQLGSAKVRKSVYESQLSEFREPYEGNKTRLAAIDKAVERYRKWAEGRAGLEDPSDLIRLITKAGVLEFRIAAVPGPDQAITPQQIDQYRELLRRHGPEGMARAGEYRWFPAKEGTEKLGGLVTASYAGKKYVLLYNTANKTMLSRPGKTGWKLSKAQMGWDQRQYPAVNFTLNAEGAQLMRQLTGDNIGARMAILLDDEFYSAPTIQSAIRGEGQITIGEFNPEEVEYLVKILNAGALPGRLNPEPVSQSTFGPTFGAANREMGKKAAIYGLIAVAVFMVIYYISAGAIAGFALLLNVILVLGAMSMLEAVLTLPGIAGVILTIGIAVDANVLIFERLREEQARAESIRVALRNAYQRALTAIIDANLTTLITCLILGWVGSEEVRGFAVTLGFGVVFSLFTALIVTRWIFQLLLDWKIITKPLTMLRVVGVPKVNWMGKRYVFWGISIVMVVMGLASLAKQGKNILGIEFSSGTKAVLTFRDDALIDGQEPNAELVRTTLESKAQELLKQDPKKYERFASLSTKIEELKDYNRQEKLLNTYDADVDGVVTKAEWDKQKKSPDFFAKLDTNGDGKIDADELTKLPERSYQIVTSETDVALIREISRDAFGKALERRTACSFDSVSNETVKELGLTINAKGYALVQANAQSHFADTLEDYSGGVVFVKRNVSPAIPAGEFQTRIDDTRTQPDFAGKAAYSFKVEGLTPGKDGYTAFAVFARSSDPSGLATEELASSVAEGAGEIVDAALSRPEAMVATNFDAAIAGKAAGNAIMAIVFSWVAIIAYLWLRFGSIRWGLAAVICLIHDVLIVVGLLAATDWISKTSFGSALGIASFKIDLPMIAAILTVIGYSVNDTIVVFDRIRENRGKLETISVHAINASINQTLARTLLTSTTTLLVVVIMYVTGGDAIRPFSFALLAGILFGTYSSIAIASPLLMGFRKALIVRTVAISEEEEPTV